MEEQKIYPPEKKIKTYVVLGKAVPEGNTFYVLRRIVISKECKD